MGEFEISINPDDFSFDLEPPVPEITDEEKEALSIVKDVLVSAGENPEELSYSRASNWLQVSSGNYIDFIRIKVGKKANWIRPYVCRGQFQREGSDAWFKNPKHKGDIIYRIPITSVAEIRDYADLIVIGYKSSFDQYAD